MNHSSIDQLGKKYNRWAIIIICVGAVFILTFPWMLSQHYWKFDFTETGQIGDTIGGITAPIIGFMSAILIYLSFMIQYRANQIQWRAIRDEQILNRLPSSINDIKAIIEKEKEDDLRRINKLTTLIVRRCQDKTLHALNYWNVYRRSYQKLTIYLEKTNLILVQINTSGIDETLKKDILLELIDTDSYWHDNLFNLQYHLNIFFEEITDEKEIIPDHKINLNDYKRLLLRLTTYRNEMIKVRQELFRN